VNHAQMTVCALTQVGFERPAPMFMSKKPRWKRKVIINNTNSMGYSSSCSRNYPRFVELEDAWRRFQEPTTRSRREPDNSLHILTSYFFKITLI
jgi:hypothetical protein